MLDSQPSENEASPDATAPDATAPDATAPDATAPNATAPNATAPNATASNGIAPDDTRVEALDENAVDETQFVSSTRIAGTITDTSRVGPPRKPLGPFKKWMLQGHPQHPEGAYESEKTAHHTHPWWKVMCLTGVDYFSTLGYQPGIAAVAAGALSPLATFILILLTLFGALPVYSRVANESPHGQGSISMLEKLFTRWKSKMFVLVLLGFVATDFIITITLSAADATAHVVENPFAPAWVHGTMAAIIITLVLISLLCAVFLKGFKEAIGIAVYLVGAYLLLNAIILGRVLYEVFTHAEYLPQWKEALLTSPGGGNPWLMIGFSLILFPKLALGLSGFETGTAVMPLVQGDAGDSPEQPAGRIRNTRRLLRNAALIMSVFLIASSVSTTLLIPKHEFMSSSDLNAYFEKPEGQAFLQSAKGRAYIERETRKSAEAHGANHTADTSIPTTSATTGANATGVENSGETSVASTSVTTDVTTAATTNTSSTRSASGGALFVAERPGEAYGRALAFLAHEYLGDFFGTAYDISTILILWFAGASAMAGLLNIVPRYLPRYGMAPDWAQATRPLAIVFTVIAFVVTIIFKADVNAQGAAYATGVLVLISSASIAVTITANRRGEKKAGRMLAVIALVFVYTTIVNIVERPDGLKIAMLFVLAIVIVSFFSRVSRTTELRVERVELDETAQRFIEEIGKHPIRIIANKRQAGDLREYVLKEDKQREDSHIPAKFPILFLEIDVLDASEFSSTLKVRGVDIDGYRVLRAESATVPNAVAALMLHMRDITGKRPHAYFNWSEGNPLVFMMRYLLLGEGDTAPVTREVLRKAERDPLLRPMIHVDG